MNNQGDPLQVAMTVNQMRMLWCDLSILEMELQDAQKLVPKGSPAYHKITSCLHLLSPKIETAGEVSYRTQTGNDYWAGGKYVPDTEFQKVKPAPTKQPTVDTSATEKK